MTLRKLLYTCAILPVVSTSAACAGGRSVDTRFPVPDQARVIRSGETLAGTIGESDPQLEDGSHYDLFAFEGAEGEQVEITLRSEAFDAFLTLGQTAGGVLKPIASDDDGAGSLDARITAVLPASGGYLVRANTFGESELGEYQLSFVSLGVPPEPSRSTLRADGSAAGALESGDAWLPEGSYFDYWEIEGTPGEVVRIDMESDDFDSHLTLGTEEDGEFREVRENDDGGEGLNARVYGTVPASGRYLVRARSLGRRQTGAYRIAVTSEGVARAPETVAISLDEEVEGTLRPLDRVLDDGVYYDEYTFRGAAGDAVVIELISEDFDAYLQLGTGSGNGFEEIASDDDGASGLNSRIRQRLPRTGEYVIRARSLDASETGEYTLSLEAARPEPPVSRSPIVAQQPAHGSLDESDRMTDGGKYHDLWLYQGTAGETVRVEMRSIDFDAYLSIGTEADGEFREMESDDDGAGGRNSRIVLTFPRSGEYVVRATSFGEEETGDYVLTITPDAQDTAGPEI